MKTLNLLVVCVCLEACVANVVPCTARCEVTVPDRDSFRSVSGGEKLPDALRRSLGVLAKCDVDRVSLEEAGFTDKSASGQSPVEHAAHCLSVVRWSNEGTFVAFYLGRVQRDGRTGPEEFLMIGTFDGTRWRFTWPADIGPSRIG